jgi:hypothetical protein
MFQLLGSGLRTGSIVLSRDETAALNKLYGFKEEKPNKKPPKPELKVPELPADALPWQRQDAEKKAKDDHKRALELWNSWTDPRPFYQAGADRNMVRHAEGDGLRLVAWLAKYVPEGEDPLKSLIQLAVDAGWDVDPADVEWAEAEVDEDAAE